jgi:hypothetical protein
MRKILIVFLMILQYGAAWCQHPYTQGLKQLATITFPDTPKLNKTTTGSFYSYNSHGRIYMASCSKWSNGPGDEFTRDLADTAYASLIREVNGFPGIKMFYKKKIIIDHLRGIEYGFVSLNDSVKYYRYHRALYLKNSLILYGFSSYDSTRIDPKALDSFYATFKVIAPDKDRSQETIADTLFNTKAALWAALALLTGVLIIFVIKKIS